MLEPIIVSDKSYGPYIRYSEYVMDFLDMYKSISYKYMQGQSTYIVYRDKFGWFTTFYDIYFILWVRKYLKLVFYSISLKWWEYGFFCSLGNLTDESISVYTPKLKF